VLLLAASVAIAACGKSPEDKAYDSGKAVGKAVRELRDASSLDQAKNAVQDLRDASKNIGEDARKAIKDQVDTQTSTLSKAAGSVTSGDTGGLKSAIDDVRAQSEAFQHSNNSVANGFWRGFEDGYDG
jgi:hypothetical protein